MEPSSSMVYSAEMLSCRNRPSGSFFCSAYHFPAYCDEKEGSRQSVMLLLTFLNMHIVFVFQLTYPLRFKVIFDGEAVNHTGSRQTELYTGHQDQQQGHLRGSHSVMNTHFVNIII